MLIRIYTGFSYSQIKKEKGQMKEKKKERRKGRGERRKRERNKMRLSFLTATSVPYTKIHM